MYPILVREDEEAIVRKAAELINEKVKLYRSKFNVKDDQDLLVMIALELATDNLKINRNTLHSQNQLQQQLHGVDLILNRIMENTTD